MKNIRDTEYYKNKSKIGGKSTQKSWQAKVDLADEVLKKMMNGDELHFRFFFHEEIGDFVGSMYVLVTPDLLKSRFILGNYFENVQDSEQNITTIIARKLKYGLRNLGSEPELGAYQFAMFDPEEVKTIQEELVDKDVINEKDSIKPEKLGLTYESERTTHK